LTVGYALVYSNKNYKNQLIDYNITREGSFALFFMERKLRDKSPEKVEIQNDGDKIIIEENGNTTYITKSGGNLVYFDGSKESVLIKNIVEDINFEKEKDDLVKIYILLKQDNFSESMETKVKLRNK